MTSNEEGFYRKILKLFLIRSRTTSDLRLSDFLRSPLTVPLQNRLNKLHWLIGLTKNHNVDLEQMFSTCNLCCMNFKRHHHWPKAPKSAETSDLSQFDQKRNYIRHIRNLFPSATIVQQEFEQHIIRRKRWNVAKKKYVPIGLNASDSSGFELSSYF